MYSPVFFTPGSKSFREEPKQASFRKTPARYLSPLEESDQTTSTFDQTSAYSPTLVDYVLLPLILYAGIPRLTIVTLLKPFRPREATENVY